MFKSIFKRTISSALNPSGLSGPRQQTVQSHSKRVLEAINSSLPILNMRKEEVDSELRSLEKEMSPCQMNPGMEEFVKTSLVNFRAKMIKSVSIDERRIDEMSKYILETPSKLFRPSIALMVHKILQPFNDNLDCILELCKGYELIHIGSLVHDDILDESQIRRKAETLHTRFGVKPSVLVGDFLLSRSAKIISNLNSIQLVQKVADTLQDLITGEILFVKLNDNMCENYLRKVYLKTASLISNNISSIPVLYNMENELNELFYLIGVHIGIGFQICDDLLDYNSNVNSLGKPLLNDLKSGLITLPLIYTMHGGESKDVVELFKENKVDDILSVMNANPDYIDRCRLAMYYHLYQAKLLLRQFNPVHTHSLLNYIHRTISRS